MGFKTILYKIYKSDRRKFLDAFNFVFKKNKKYNFLFRFKHGNGYKWFFSENSIEFKNGVPCYIFGIIQDLTEIYQQEENISNLGRILDDSLNEIQIIDLETIKFLHVNKQSLKSLEYSEKEITQIGPLQILSSDFGKEKYILMINELISKKINNKIIETHQKRKNGTVYPVEIHYFLSRFRNRDVVVGIALDITEKNQTQKQLKHLAYHDLLTGLFNRAYITKYIDMLISKNKNFAILYLDLDKFKTINDTLGHSFGDELLKEVGKELTIIIDKKGHVARIGGDEFLIVIENVAIKKHVKIICESIIKRMLNKFSIKKHDLYVGASMGLVFCPEQANTLDEIVAHSDWSMYYAKSAGGNQYVEFTSEISLLAKEKIQLEKDLQKCVNSSNDIVAYFQPQVDLKTNKIIGGEALSRWIKPDGSMVMPNKFIKIAEESNLIKEIGYNVLRQSCRYAVLLNSLKKADFRLAVNVSGKQLVSDEEVQKIIKIVEEENCPPKFIELEITEGILMEPTKELIERLFLLKSKGFKLALDDFGTGYSSLSYINKFPLDFIKIDASFINTMDEDGVSATIVQTIIALGHGLGIKIIAEGVETKAQFDLLKQYQCDYVQGYYIGKAINQKDFLLKINQKLEL